MSLGLYHYPLWNRKRKSLIIFSFFSVNKKSGQHLKSEFKFSLLLSDLCDSRLLCCQHQRCHPCPCHGTMPWQTYLKISFGDLKCWNTSVAELWLVRSNTFFQENKAWLDRNLIDWPLLKGCWCFQKLSFKCPLKIHTIFWQEFCV